MGFFTLGLISFMLASKPLFHLVVPVKKPLCACQGPENTKLLSDKSAIRRSFLAKTAV